MSAASIVRRFIVLWFKAVLFSFFGAIGGALAGLLVYCCVWAVVGLLAWNSATGGKAAAGAYALSVVIGWVVGCIAPLVNEADNSNSPFSKRVLFMIGAFAFLFDLGIIGALSSPTPSNPNPPIQRDDAAK
jgi:hypothetical protein